MNRLARITALVGATLLAALPVGCGDSAVSAARYERSDEPAVVAAREALDHLRIAEARSLLDGISGLAGAEEPLLRARLAALEGDLFEALRLVRTAREASPNDPAPAATLVEIFAWNGRLREAGEEFDAARATFGRTPELVRAHGVLGICTPGGSKSGLELLLEAERADPSLPFLDRSLGQAHLLAASAALGEARIDDAIAHAEACLARLPGDPDARETMADALATGPDLDRAVEMYEALYAEGAVELKPKLVNALHNSATAAMVAGLAAKPEGRAKLADRREALYLRMRELGVRQADLGSGTAFLAGRADVLVDDALALLDSLAALERLHARGAGGADVASSIAQTKVRVTDLVERAMRLDPTLLKARAVRAELYFDEQRFREAAEMLEGLCIENAATLDQLAVPIHLNAARAWYRAGETSRAATLLRDYLASNPTGKWVDDTQIMLASF